MIKNKLTFLLASLLSAGTLHATDPFFDDPFGDDIFNDMYEMQQEMDKVFERMHKQMRERSQKFNRPGVGFYVPGMSDPQNEMFVDKGAYYLYDTGVEANSDNEINLVLRGNVLTFKAKVTKQNTATQQGMQSQQHHTSMIQRSQTLPHDADPESVKMEEKEGMIIVLIEKKKALQKAVITAPSQPSKASKPPKTDEKSVDPDKPSLMPSHQIKEEDKEYRKVPNSMSEA
jgi:HSP20 family protein